jgi:CheY-like chemotaxis protein
MDVQMPNMDGYEATAAIRALDRADACGVPIIALTANAFKEDIDKALMNGMNAHLSKPLEADKLIEVSFKYLFGKTS